MTKHRTGTREEWLAARLELLEAEKEHTRRSDELAQRRRELPWVRIGKSYRFDTDAGPASLADLFRGRSQLLVYHFMFGPDYTAGCPSCSAIADGFNGFAVHLANHDVMLWAVSRAPLAKLQAYKQRLGWTFPWASSSSTDFNADFNADFNVRFTEEQQQAGIEYNYRREAPLPIRARGAGADLEVSEFSASAGTDQATYSRARPASSTTPIPPMRAGWTASGACTSGSTALPWAATKRVSGGAATTSTASDERDRARRSCHRRGADLRVRVRASARPRVLRRLGAAPGCQRGADGVLVRIHDDG